MIAFGAVGVFFIEPQYFHPGSLPPAATLSTAILLAAFAYFGFDATAVLAGEVRDAPRAVPFAILLSMAGVPILYALIQIVCVGTLPNLAASQRPLADAAITFIGPWSAIVVALAAVISCAGVFGASLTPATRLLFAMADGRQLTAVLARVHTRFHTPVFAILVTAGAILVLALSGSFIYLVKVTLIARVTVYAATCAILPIFRRRENVPEAAFKVPCGRSVAYGCAILCVLLLANSSMRELLDVAVAMALGLAIFGLSQVRSPRRHPRASASRGTRRW